MRSTYLVKTDELILEMNNSTYRVTHDYQNRKKLVTGKNEVFLLKYEKQVGKQVGAVFGCERISAKWRGNKRTEEKFTPKGGGRNK